MLAPAWGPAANPMTTHGVFSFPNATTGDVDRFIYDSPIQVGATLPAASDTDRNICWADDRTPARSANVGPDSGQGGDPEGFLYSECSSPGVNGDVYTLEFDTALDASAEQWQFNFYRMQRGPAIGNNQSTMTVQINESGGGWVDVTGELGGSGNDVATHNWGSEVSIDLSEGGTNVNSSTRVRIRWVSQAATTWWADVGVDEIEIVGTPLASKEQDSFRFYEDGTESGAAARENQNIDLTIGQEDTFGIRIGGQMTGDPPTESATLQYKETSDGAAEWRDVP